MRRRFCIALLLLSVGSAASAGREKSAVPASVELYTTTWCGYCRQARSYLRSKGVSFKEYDVESDAAAASRFRRLNPRGGVPLAVINGRSIVGFNRPAYEQALSGREEGK